MTGRPGRHERLRLMAIAAIAAAALVATWLRVRGLAFGLPAIYNPDEIAIMSRALAFATGDLNPHNFLYPTLYFYLLFAWEGMYFAAGWLIGLIPSRAAFQQSFFVDPTGIFLAGRMLGVACGVGSVLATWRLGTRVAGAVAGIAAAWFLAIAPFAVRDAHYVKHDVPTTLAVVLAVLAASRLADASPARRTRWLVAAAIMSGLATSMHYYAVFVCLPLAWAAWIAWRDQPVLSRARAIAAAAAVSALAFMAGSPYLAAEPFTALRDIQANRQIVIDRAVATSHGAFASLPAYARMLWNDATGWPVTLLALCGIVVLLRRNWHAAVLVIVFPVVFFLFIGNTVAATRYLNPMLPFVAVLAGVTVAAVARRFTPASSRGRGNRRGARGWCACAGRQLEGRHLFPADGHANAGARLRHDTPPERRGSAGATLLGAAARVPRQCRSRAPRAPGRPRPRLDEVPASTGAPPLARPGVSRRVSRPRRPRCRQDLRGLHGTGRFAGTFSAETAAMCSTSC